MTTVDVRCPVNASRLFMRLRLRDPEVRIDPGSNLLEVLCRDCGRAAGARVLHRYDITGELIETVTLSSRVSGCTPSSGEPSPGGPGTKPAT